MAIYYFAHRLQQNVDKVKATLQDSPIYTISDKCVPGYATTSCTGPFPGSVVSCRIELNQPRARDQPQHQLLQVPVQIHCGNRSLNLIKSTSQQQPVPCSSSTVLRCPKSPKVANQPPKKEKSGLVYQGSNLISGSLFALVKHFVPTTSYYPDGKFVFTFLLSSRLHIPPIELLCVVDRLAFAVTANSSSPDCQTGVLIKIVANVVQLLKDWMEIFPYDFRNERMIAQVNYITRKCVAINPTVEKDVTLILNNLLGRLTGLQKYERFLHESTLETTPRETQPSVCTWCPDPKLLAEQLTHIEQERLSQIGPEEFVQVFVTDVRRATEAREKATSLDSIFARSSTTTIIDLKCDSNVGKTLFDGKAATFNDTALNGASSSGGRIAIQDWKKTRNVENYLKWFNYLCHIVSTDVCEPAMMKLRVKAIEYWIEVAEECFVIGNFNSLMAIITGLSVYPVLRMNETWKKVDCNKLSSLLRRMDPFSNFTAYRTILQSVASRATNQTGDGQTKVLIPFFSLLIKDILPITLGAATLLPNGHINFEKCRQLAKLVTDVMTWRQLECPFPKIPSIINKIQVNPVLSEDALLLTSFELEPPETYEEQKI